eukprot:TRINITY_DN5456_c0_g1_i1.p1 TRINITY_DN5456_c0_g1~~TRINITY_DN5456_c0_g1_i1.p1  ORF type:complete len:106 (+),score=25.38 TRINITY_DN5456_c0_g1_i1:31-348(+)
MRPLLVFFLLLTTVIAMSGKTMLVSPVPEADFDMIEKAVQAWSAENTASVGELKHMKLVKVLSIRGIPDEKADSLMAYLKAHASEVSEAGSKPRVFEWDGVATIC